MGRVKQGKKVHRKDLWVVAGGRESVVTAMRSANISERDTNYSSEIWSELFTTLFGENNPKNCYWLYIIWTRNRKEVRVLSLTGNGVNQEQDLPLNILETKSDEMEEEVHRFQQGQSEEGIERYDLEEKEADEGQQKMLQMGFPAEEQVSEESAEICDLEESEADEQQQ